MDSVTFSQPGGLTLALVRDDTMLRVRVVGEGLTAEASANLHAETLAQFFADAASGVSPPWGRWEYKADDDAVVLHAGPDGAGGMLLAVNLLASSDDASDWQLSATVVLSLEEFRDRVAAAALLFRKAQRSR